MPLNHEKPKARKIPISPSGADNILFGVRIQEALFFISAVHVAIEI